jgi:hypothetical protein
MNITKKISIVLFLLRICVPLYARGWSACNETVGCCPFRDKPLVSLGKRADVVPLGYPYGNDRSSRPYLAPFAHAAPYEFGQPFTFGYVAVESTGRRQPRGSKICDNQTI